MKIHHASKRGREAHPIRNTAVSVKPHQFIPLGHIVQKTVNKGRSTKKLGHLLFKKASIIPPCCSLHAKDSEGGGDSRRGLFYTLLKAKVPVFIIGKKCIRHPNFLSKVASERQRFLFIAERQSLIFPVLV